MSIIDDPRLISLIDEETISDKVRELGSVIHQQYQHEKESVVLIGVLKGSFIFLADLVRAIDLPIQIEMMGLSSYGAATESSGVVRITQDLTKPIKDKHVIIVEDIFDTGLTLKYLVGNLSSRGPKSIKVCTLLKKQISNQADVKLDFVGFEIPDKFVVGYGLDVADRFRNLPMVAIYKP